MSPAQADTGGKEGPLQEHKESLPGLETYLSCSLHLPRLIGVIIKCYFKGKNARAVGLYRETLSPQTKAKKGVMNERKLFYCVFQWGPT